MLLSAQVFCFLCKEKKKKLCFFFFVNLSDITTSKYKQQKIVKVTCDKQVLPNTKNSYFTPSLLPLFLFCFLVVKEEIVRTTTQD